MHHELILNTIVFGTHQTEYHQLRQMYPNDLIV